ncbi:NUDIX domain-containing protein [Gallaecimonas mangrovi]|uniref:NUDIX domain-containing protein n=1 Tax=Gallaecimonas mangrovi TaxID=2291597 RepID=UPI000E1FB8AD|nr:NUDIX domain-containing protein [Gallaecimonas mangrovi]
MKFALDHFNGVIIDPNALPENPSQFSAELAELLAFARGEQKNLIWLTLPISHALLVGEATAQGFVFHNCQEQEVTLIHKAPSTEFVPFIPTHTLGAGALVLNAQQQLLVVQEHGMQGYKLPGGHIELGEKIESSIIREVREETGIATRFEAVLGFTSRQPVQFGRTNIYFICRMTPLTEHIAIEDSGEILDARWVALDSFVNDPRNAAFNRQMVAELVGTDGLKPIEPVNNTGPYKKHETFFATKKPL